MARLVFGKVPPSVSNIAHITKKSQPENTYLNTHTEVWYLKKDDYLHNAGTIVAAITRHVEFLCYEPYRNMINRFNRKEKLQSLWKTLE